MLNLRKSNKDKSEIETKSITFNKRKEQIR